MSNLYYINASDFSQEGGHMTANIGGVSLIMFHSNRCPHCIAFLPEFKRLPGAMMGLNFGTCCVDDGNRSVVEMSKQSSTPITSVPKFILYVEGRPYVEYSGQRSRPAILAFLQEISAKINQSLSFARPRRTRQQEGVGQQPGMQYQQPAMQQQQPPQNAQMAPPPPQARVQPPRNGGGGYELTNPNSSVKIAPNTGVKEYETSYGRPYNTTNEMDFLEYERAYRETHPNSGGGFKK